MQARRCKYSDHQLGHGPRVLCEGMEGIISNRADARPTCRQSRLVAEGQVQNREEFVVVGWTDPEGARHCSGRYCLATTIQTGGCLCRARRDWMTMWSSNGFGVGYNRSPLPKCHSTRHRLRTTVRFTARAGECTGVRPELVAEVQILTWTGNNLLVRSFTRVSGRTRIGRGLPSAPNQPRSAASKISDRSGLPSDASAKSQGIRPS